MVNLAKGAGKAEAKGVGVIVKTVARLFTKDVAKVGAKDVGKTVLKDTEKALVKDTEKALVKDTEKALVKDGEKALVKDGEKAALKDGEEAASKTPLKDRETCGDPVDMATGEVVLAQTDVSLPGVLPLVLQRSHISSYQLGRLFGPSWASTLDQRIEVDDEGVHLATEDGMVLVYPSPPPSGEVLPEAGPRWPLSRAGAGYQVADPLRGWTWHFAPLPGREADPEARWVTLPLTALTHRGGDRVDVWYGADGVVEEVRHSGGYRVAVDTADGRVVGLRLLDGDRDVTVVRFSYDGLGNLAEVVNSSGQPLQFDYDLAGRLTGWTDRNATAYRYDYDQDGRCVRTWGSDEVMASTIAYDTEARATTYTDSLGHRKVFGFDERGKLVREVDALGQITYREWDRYGRLLSETDPLGRTTTRTYDEVGHLTSLTRPDGVRIELSYDEAGRLVGVTEADGTLWRHGHDDRGNLVEVTDPAGATTRYGYDERNHLASVADAFGNVTAVRCDGAGLPVEMLDPTGATTTVTRDGAGRVVAVTDPLGGVTRHAYSPEGWLTWRQQPDGAEETFCYDGEGNLTARVDPLGATTRFEYTHFDQPSARIDPDGTRLAFAYDTELRLTSVTNPQGLVWSYTYDPAGRLVAETDFNGAAHTYTLDAAGQLAARTNPLGQTTHYSWDALGNLTGKQTPEGGTEFGYDPAGLLVHARSPQAEVTIERDVLGRVLAETVNGATIQYAYDVAGRRVARRTPSGAESHWEFDVRDQPAALHSGGQTLRFTHDQAGRQIGTTLIGDVGLQLARSFDPNHRLIAQTLTTGVSPGPAPGGPGPGSVPGSARTLASRTYQYRPDGLLSAVEDAATGRRTFDLDRTGRITAVTAHDWSERYAYDSAGNLTQATWPDSGSGSGSAPGTADAVGDREYTGTLLRRAGSTRYEHDAAGRVVLRQRKRLSTKPATWHYTWDSDDRLTAVTCPDGTRWVYTYDPLGRRLAKHHLDAAGQVLEQTAFSWDGLTLAEQTHWTAPDASPRSTTWDYRPGTFTPIAQTDRHWLATADQHEIDQRFHAIITDLVGAPTELVTPDGDITWHTQTTIWGTTTTVAARAADVDCPLRLPGQYHDAETGDHYNAHRYYDPTTARYHTPDPLGLTPAPNPHTYVPNPTHQIDPLGLASGGCGTQEFFSVQGSGDVVRLLERDGQPWPSGAGHGSLRDVFGSGLYTFESRAQAERYLELLSKRSGGADLTILVHSISTEDLARLTTADMTHMSDEVANVIYDLGADHGFEHLVRKTGNFGVEHFFCQDVYHLFTSTMG